ncbi:UNVERIFIED_CONTAM: hypothetical protein BEN50_23290 [Euhalothece sp. KZN 001]
MHPSGEATYMGERETIDRLREVAAYQFGPGAGEALFPADETGQITVHRSTSGRPRQLIAPTGRICSYGTDGRFTLGIEGGRRLVAATTTPRCRVCITAEAVPYVRAGRNVFAKFVTAVDERVRGGDEVAVCTTEDRLVGVGTTRVSAALMLDADYGMAVKTREAIPDSEANGGPQGDAREDNRH